MSTVADMEARLPYHDLRQWMARADALGELRTVTGASWEEDIGLAADAVIRVDDGPAVLFDEVPGCPKGFRVLINTFAGKRRNMTLGFPEHLTKQELSQAFFEHYIKVQRRLPHVVVDDGPVFENILTGDDVDVMKFPTPKWHADDGGRYIGTGCFCVTIDPEERWINVGTYRAMVQARDSVSLLFVPGKHAYMHRKKYFDKGQPMPVALVVGSDPMSFFVGGTEFPYGVCEFDIVGGLRGAPVEVVRGKVTGLPFPANAEIVLEGFLTEDNRAVEGPFGEWTGYYAGGASEQPTLDVRAIYHRNDPIILGVPPLGAGPDEMARYRAIMRSAMLKQELTNAGVPDVTQVWCHEVGASRLLHGIGIKQRYPGHARQAARWPPPAARWCTAASSSSWWTTTSTYPTWTSWYGRCSPAATRRLPSRSCARCAPLPPTLGSRRSSARPGTSPTPASSSTPAVPSSGSTSIPRSTRPARRWSERPMRNSATCWSERGRKDT